MSHLKRDAKKMKAAVGGRPTSGSYKRFDPQAFSETQGAVEAVAQYLASQDITATANSKDPKGADLIVWTGFRPSGYIEVAQRSAWKEGEWPERWDPINIEERKLRLFQLSLPCEYWVVCKDLRSALVVPVEVVRKYLGVLEEVSNRAVKHGEQFIRIPLVECIRKVLT